MPDFKELLDNVGLRSFSEEELFAMQATLIDQIKVGLQRQDETQWPADGGVQAIPTHVQPITFEQMSAAPIGSTALVAACGGTNWIFTVARKESNTQVRLEESVVVTIPESQRTHTFESLLELIAKHLIEAAKQYYVDGYEQIPIGISFGFPQRNVVLDNGDIDARIVCGRLPKKWRITDASDALPSLEEQTSLAELLRAKLIEGGLDSVGKIVFTNDTVAVSLDVQHGGDAGANIPAGFVFGTGTNAAIMGSTDQGLVNLEAGHGAVGEADAVFKKMLEREYVSTPYPEFEHWVGGGYLQYRVAAALECIQDEYPIAAKWVDIIASSNDQSLVSDLASGRLQCVPTEDCTTEDRALLQECGERALAQAGQLMAAQVAAAVHVLGTKEDTLYAPFEGGVLQKAFGVSDTMYQTLQILLPEQKVELYTASGMVGIAKMIMAS